MNTHQQELDEWMIDQLQPDLRLEITDGMWMRARNHWLVSELWNRICFSLKSKLRVGQQTFFLLLIHSLWVQTLTDVLREKLSPRALLCVTRSWPAFYLCIFISPSGPLSCFFSSFLFTCSLPFPPSAVYTVSSHVCVTLCCLCTFALCTVNAFAVCLSLEARIPHEVRVSPFFWQFRLHTLFFSVTQTV